MSDIFLSYASNDRKRILPLAKALEAQGWTVFWDRNIPVGKTWLGVISDEIRRCRCVLVVWTEASKQSEWVIEEANEGKKRGILFPVSLDHTEPPFGFGNIQSADLSDWKSSKKHAGFQILISELSQYLQNNEAPLSEDQSVFKTPPDINSPKPLNKSKNNKALLIGLIGTVALGSATFFGFNSGLVPSLFDTKENKPDDPSQPVIINPRDQTSRDKQPTEAEQKELKKEEQAKKLADEKKAKEDAALVEAKKKKAAERKAKEEKEKAEKERAERERLATIAEHTPKMVSIPAGSFKMGCVSGKDCYDDEKPVRTVNIPAFHMSQYEVTFKQWDACVKEGACQHKPDDEGWGRGDHPVINVSWDDTQEYVQWLSKTTGESYRLPSEAEWEYAARAGTNTAYPWGNKASHTYANYGKDECCGGLAKGKDEWVYTAPVGSFKSNKYNLYDMQGNVWEWVQDCYHKTYNNAPNDNKAWQTENCEKRVLRGGSWFIKPRYMRSANRYWSYPTFRLINYGFRVARTP